MHNNVLFFQDVRHTRILKHPKNAMTNLGTTTLRYILLSPMPGEPASCRLRQGEVTAERPQILTPEFWKNRFEGFGEQTEEIHKQIDQEYGEPLKALQYSFPTALKTTSLHHPPFSQVPD